MEWLETVAFTLVIGAQFLAAIFLSTNRHVLYGERNQDWAHEVTVSPITLTTSPSNPPAGVIPLAHQSKRG